jgi:hypothetical protein
MHMTPVQGLLQRHGKGSSKVIVKMLKALRRLELQGHLTKYVLKGSRVFTDAAPAYANFADNPDYTHEVIDHAECYAKGTVHTRP